MSKPAVRDGGARALLPSASHARHLLLAGVLACGLGSTGQVFAAGRSHPEFEAVREPPLPRGVAPQFDVGSLAMAEPSKPPSGQFSPRKFFAPDQAPESAATPGLSLGTTTVWQRLKDYRSRDRVRLLTLFETAGSTVSLQAGRHGEASVQWTSRSLNRGGSTRGLLDHILAASLGAAGIAMSGSGRPGIPSAGGSAPVRPSRPVSVVAAAGYAP